MSDASRGAERDLRYNFGVLLGHGLLGQTGFKLLQAPTFLPYFVSQLAGNNLAVGLARSAQSLGQFVSPFIAARLIEHRDYAKGLTIVFGAAMRIQVLFLALIALFVPPEHALWLVWLVLGLLGLGLGMQGVAFNFIMSKAIPANRRGGLIGIRNFTSMATLIAVAAFGGWLLERYGYPDGYGYIFLTAFVLTAVGLAIFALFREPPSVERPEPVRISQRVREIWPLLRDEPDFSRFLVAQLLGIAARGAFPFYIVFVERDFGVSGQRLAAFTILFTLTEGGFAPLWGFVADRRGFKLVMIVALLVWMIGTGLLLTVPRIEAAYATFLLVGAGWGGFAMGCQSIVLEFGSAADRPMRLATSHSLAEGVGMLGFLLAGVIAQLFSLEIVFCAALVLLLAALWWTSRIREPRHAHEPGPL